jgi:hypothetical protein
MEDLDESSSDSEADEDEQPIEEESFTIEVKQVKNRSKIYGGIFRLPEKLRVTHITYVQF